MLAENKGVMFSPAQTRYTVTVHYEPGKVAHEAKSGEEGESGPDPSFVIGDWVLPSCASVSPFVKCE